MSPIFSALLVLLVFALRDGAVLPRLGRSLLPYALGTAALWTAMGWWAESVSLNQVLEWKGRRTLWISALAIHLALALAAFLWRSRPSRLATMALLPAPTLVMAIGALAWLALARWNGLPGWGIGLAFSTIWLAGVWAVGRWLRPADDTISALAVGVHLTAGLLIPFQSTADKPAAATPFAGWVAMALPLIVTASLVALSYLFHRWRQDHWPGDHTSSATRT
jgi:hypothetical protein